LPAALIQAVKRAPVPHKPWKMAHPETGKEVQPGEMLTLPNGKQVQAKDYYDQLNRMEKQFNGLGHSLRDTAKKVLLQETKIDKARMKAQALAVAAKHRTFDPKTMRQPTALKALPAAHQAAVKAAKVAPAAKAGGGKTKSPPVAGRSLAAVPGGGKAKSDRELKTFSFPVGDNKTVSVFLDGRWETNVSTEAVDLKGEAHAGAYLLNNRIEVLTATAELRASGATGSAKLTFSVLGQVVHNPNLPVQATGLRKGDQVSKTIDHFVPFSFALGPIPVSGKVGARGTVGVGYFFGVNTQPLYANVQVVPRPASRATPRAASTSRSPSAA
jgi:hypothetical protein